MPTVALGSVPLVTCGGVVSIVTLPAADWALAKPANVCTATIEWVPSDNGIEFVTDTEDPLAIAEPITALPLLVSSSCTVAPACTPVTRNPTDVRFVSWSELLVPVSNCDCSAGADGTDNVVAAPKFAALAACPFVTVTCWVAGVVNVQFGGGTVRIVDVPSGMSRKV